MTRNNPESIETVRRIHFIKDNLEFLASWCNKADFPCYWNRDIKKSFTDLNFSNLNLTPFSHWKSTILLVNFNFPVHENIDLILRLYSSFFKSVVICSSFHNISALSKLSNLPFDYINLQSGTVYGGYYMHQCLNKLIERNRSRGIDGYLFINDDLLLNTWVPFDIKRVRGVHYNYSAEKWHWDDPERCSWKKPNETKVL